MKKLLATPVLYLNFLENMSIQYSLYHRSFLSSFIFVLVPSWVLKPIFSFVLPAFGHKLFHSLSILPISSISLSSSFFVISSIISLPRLPYPHVFSSSIHATIYEWPNSFTGPCRPSLSANKSEKLLFPPYSAARRSRDNPSSKRMFACIERKYGPLCTTTTCSLVEFRNYLIPCYSQ